MRSISVMFAAFVLLFGATSSATPQDGPFPACIGGDSIHLSAEFAPGKVGILEPIREEVLTHIPRIKSHLIRERTCLAVYGTSDEMRWQRASTETATDSLDAAISYTRGWIIGQLVRREVTGPDLPDFPVRVAALAGDLNRSAVIVLGYEVTMRDGGGIGQVDLDRLSALIRENGGRLDDIESDLAAIGLRVTAVEGDVEELKKDVIALKEAREADLNVGVGYAFTEKGYSMPHLRASHFFGNAYFGGNLGGSPDQGHHTYIDGGNAVESKTRRWSYGLHLVWLPISYGENLGAGPAFWCGNNEDLVLKAGHWRERYRGCTLGVQARVNLLDLADIIATPYLGRFEEKWIEKEATWSTDYGLQIAIELPLNFN